MSVKCYTEFVKFCSSFHIEHIENGYLKGDDWQHASLKAPYHRLYIVLDGEGTLFLDDRVEYLKKGFAYVVPAGMDYRCDSPVYLEKLYLHFITDNIYMDDPFGNAESIYSMPIDTEPYQAVVNALENQESNAYYRIKAHYEMRIYEMIDMLIADGRFQVGNMFSRELIRFNELIEQNLSAKLKTAWMAGQLGMSQSGLSKFSRRLTGRTVKQIIIERLIKKAQILLLTTEMSIQEIAIELGYEDTLYFTKVFSQTVGIPPTSYRRENINY